jgi:hypothetical protein
MQHSKLDENQVLKSIPDEVPAIDPQLLMRDDTRQANEKI